MQLLLDLDGEVPEARAREAVELLLRLIDKGGEAEAKALRQEEALR